MSWGWDNETSSQVRSRRVLAGECMVTPTKPISLGGNERLEPNSARLVVDHQLVRARPELFEPADKSDRSTRSALRSLLEAAELTVTRELARRSGEPEPRTSTLATLYGLRPSRERPRARWQLKRRHDPAVPGSAGVLPLPTRSARHHGAYPEPETR